MRWSELNSFVYFEGALGDIGDPMPGIRLEAALSLLQSGESEYVSRKLIQSGRKLCLMWYAGDQALYHEADFYISQNPEMPSLCGEDAVRVHFHLEALILLGRSACDIAAGAFSQVLPDPFPRQRIDSFNNLCKVIESGRAPATLVEYISALRSDPHSWLSLLAGSERGRSLRDKIAHQTEFPIDYVELKPNSDKEFAVVTLDHNTILPLPDFVDKVRYGIVDGFRHLEDHAVSFLESVLDR